MLKNTSKTNYFLPSSFLQPQNLLFLNIPESELVDYLQEVHHLISREPVILEKIEADLDAHAKQKKRLRLLDRYWELSQSRQLPLPTIEIASVEIKADELRLQGGRSRMSAYLVYMFLMIRGFWSGVKCSEFQLLLAESKTIQLFLDSYNEGKMPGFSTISENINSVSNETREFILDAQIRMTSDEGLDDFKCMTIDSTSVSGNSAWPTDSRILTNLVIRTFHRGKKLHKFGIPNMADRRFPDIIKTMKELSKKIDFTVKKRDSKAKRKKIYRKLLKEARSAHKTFESEFKKVRKSFSHLNIEPSRDFKLKRLFEWMEDDVNSMLKVIGYCSQRINHNETTPSKDKILSLSDKSVGFIKKGDREAVIGYKPQLGRSKNGFIPAFKVPEGNAADSGEFSKIAGDGIRRTGVMPDSISCDDGYANRGVRDELLALGVKVVSISGSKGKKITSQEDWESQEYVEARNNRSAVESLMFTIKYGFNFGKVMRRGIENVRAELLEKVLAYNFCRMSEVRKWPKALAA
jgi:hypothetical protein